MMLHDFAGLGRVDFVGIVGAMTWFVIRYRRRPGMQAERRTHHSTWLEITWSVIPLLLLIVIFAQTGVDRVEVTVVPVGTLSGPNHFLSLWMWSRIR